MTTPGAPLNPGSEDARHTKQDLVAGRIVRPHGVRGELVVEPESEVLDQVRPGMLLYLGQARSPRRVTAIRPHQARFLFSFEGCSSRPEAEAMRGLELYLPLDQVSLPEGVYFRWQLIGLRVRTEDGRLLGELVEVIGTGANDVYEVRLDDGRSVLLPAIELGGAIDRPGGGGDPGAAAARPDRARLRPPRLPRCRGCDRLPPCLPCGRV